MKQTHQLTAIISDKEGDVESFYFGILYAGMGDMKKAYQCLEKARQ